VYLKRGFRITHFLLDGAFELLRGDLAALHITLNTISDDEHVPDIECFIRTLKERTRCIYNSLPFQRFPPRILAEMVYAATFWLNSFPIRLGFLSASVPLPLLIAFIIVNLTMGATFKHMKDTIIQWPLGLLVHLPSDVWQSTRQLLPLQSCLWTYHLPESLDSPYSTRSHRPCSYSCSSC
jgi:hypothetical protein